MDFTLMIELLRIKNDMGSIQKFLITDFEIFVIFENLANGNKISHTILDCFSCLLFAFKNQFFETTLLVKINRNTFKSSGR